MLQTPQGCRKWKTHVAGRDYSYGFNIKSLPRVSVLFRGDLAYVYTRVAYIDNRAVDRIGFKI